MAISTVQGNQPDEDQLSSLLTCATTFSSLLFKRNIDSIQRLIKECEIMWERVQHVDDAMKKWVRNCILDSHRC